MKAILFREILNKNTSLRKSLGPFTNVLYDVEKEFHLILDIIFITICLDGNLTTFESHSLANSIEETVSKLDNVYKTIDSNFIGADIARTADISNQTKET